MDKIDVTALTGEQRASMASAAQPAFEAHVTENLDAKASELLSLFKTSVDAANVDGYLN